MTAPVPTNEPLEARVGDTWAWNRQDLPDYPATTWTLKYQFKNATSHFEFNATADGSNFSIVVAKATTAGFTAGKYSWAAYVTDGTSQYTVATGRLNVLPSYSLASAAALDDRTHARKVLEALEATIEGKATKDQLKYMIGSRSIERLTPAELVTWRNQYRAEVFSEDNKERRQNGYGAGRLVAKL